MKSNSCTWVKRKSRFEGINSLFVIDMVMEMALLGILIEKDQCQTMRSVCPETKINCENFAVFPSALIFCCVSHRKSIWPVKPASEIPVFLFLKNLA